MSKGAPQTPAWWFGDVSPPLWTRLLAPAYAGVVALRRRLYRGGLLRPRRVDAPVLVIGNLAAGGAGKTPLTIAVVQKLREAGWRPGVASRGYGRRDPETPRWVTAETAAEEGGDEPVLVARRLAVPVRVDRDRVAAARALVESGCDIVVCDDGLQHYRLGRDIEIEVVDGVRRYGNGRMLPAGPLREPVDRSRCCDFRVVNLGPGVPGQGGRAGRDGLRRMADAAAGARGIADRRRTTACAGVLHRHPRPRGGRHRQPAAILRHAAQPGVGVVPHAFADHHAYRAEDLQFGNDLPVLMTEKDAVKCAPFADARCFSVPVDAELPAAFWVGLLDRLDRLR